MTSISEYLNTQTIHHQKKNHAKQKDIAAKQLAAEETAYTITISLPMNMLSHIRSFQQAMHLSHSSSAIRYLLYKGIQSEIKRKSHDPYRWLK